MKFKAIRLAFILVLLSVVFPNAHAFDDGDFHVWNTDGQEIKLNEKTKLFTEQEFRWGDNASRLYYQHYDIGLMYAFNNSLDLGFGYRQVLEKRNAQGKWLVENEPNINAILKWSNFGFDMSNRFRLEYRHFDYQTDSWRFRNMLTGRFPWEFTRFKIRPYLADEVHIVSRGIAVSANRAYAGFTFKILRNLNGDLYYMMQSTRSSGKWRADNVLGTKLKLSF